MGSKSRPAGRPRLGGRGQHVQQYKLNAESVDKKLCVLAYLETAGMRATINKYYGTLATASYQSKRTQIQRWKKESAMLRRATEQHKGGNKKVRDVGVGTVLSFDLEKDIVAWVNELWEEGVPVSPRMLAIKSREIATEASVANFSASDSWISGFKARHKYSMRAATRQSQISPDDINTVAEAFATLVEATA